MNRAELEGLLGFEIASYEIKDNTLWVVKKASIKEIIVKFTITKPKEDE